GGRWGRGAPAGEIGDRFATVEKIGGGARIQELRQGAKRFCLNYVKAFANTFPNAWAGRKYAIKTGAALRGFIRVVPDVMARAKEMRRDPFEAHAIRDAIKPWCEP